MRALIAFPLLFLVAILQSALVSRLPLLSGHADLMLVILASWAAQPRVTHAWEWAFLGALLIAFLSAFPWPLIFLTYLATTSIALALRKVIRSPLLTLILALFLGTILSGITGWAYLFLIQSALPFSTIFSEVTSPSLLLNLVLALVAIPLINRLASWVYPGEEENE
ncbi:MAG: hypothetical protein ACK8QZ_05930 [Anaerolineales bacterium]